MKKSTTRTVTVKSNEENAEPLEVLAQAIIDVAEAFENINKSRLSRRAVILLLKDITKLSVADIDTVLNCAPLLKKYYIKDLPKPVK